MMKLTFKNSWLIALFLCVFCVNATAEITEAERQDRLNGMMQRNLPTQIERELNIRLCYQRYTQKIDEITQINDYINNEQLVNAIKEYSSKRLECMIAASNE